MSTPPSTPKKKPVDGSGSGSAGDNVKGDAPRPVVAERVFTTSGGAVELPMLTKDNYHVWSVVMEVSLEALGLWGAVEGDEVERREDRLALAAILRAVPMELKAGLGKKETAKEAWQALKTMRVGNDRVKAANVERLLKEFENVAFRDGESVDEFVLRISGLVGSLRELGEEMKDSRVVRKILRVLPKRLKQVAVSIQMLLDLDAMSVEELLGRLRVAEEQDDVEGESAGPARLLLTEEQWEARRRQHGGKERRRGGEKGGGRNGGHGEDDDASSTSSGASGRHRGRCFTCGERGHIARNCSKARKEKALLADADDEPTLL
ncbi:hypothetical protein ACP70R_004123 [Stipagrostis hirtigluma subsp. patula]